MNSLKSVTLAALSPGKTARVVSIDGGVRFIRRLENMGLRIGQRVTKVSGIPLRGPVVVQSGGTRVGLGHGMAVRIKVEPS